VDDLRAYLVKLDRAALQATCSRVMRLLTVQILLDPGTTSIRLLVDAPISMIKRTSEFEEYPAKVLYNQTPV
jgi:hypothetical protein